MLMRSIYLIVVILLGHSNRSFAQDASCNCSSDLKLLHSKIKKTPSYKQNKDTYKESYAIAELEAKDLTSDYDCFVLLNKLLLSLNDSHCKIYGINTGATDEVKQDAAAFAAFKESAINNAYPRPDMDLDSLRVILSTKSKTDIEGIYEREGYMTIGVFQTEVNVYKAIILESESDVWRVGEIMYTLVPYGNNYMLSIGGSITSKRLIAYPERIENGLFLTMGFQKDISETNYSVSPYKDTTYIRKELSPEITYIKIGSFNSWYPTLSDAETFYKSLEGTLTKKNLIIDLRDNGGGGDRNSNILYKIIKNYLKTNYVYLITNNRTASNAEQFTYKLTQEQNCTSFGHRTNGTAAYEIVNSNYELPCDNFIAVLTSKKHSTYLDVESVGIAPDVTFAMTSEWVEQLVAIIGSSESK